MDEMPMAGINPGNIPEASSKPAQTYVSVCTQCHGLPDPKRRSIKGWEKVVERMEGHMLASSTKNVPTGRQGKKVLVMSDKQRETIFGYLGKNGFKPLKKTAKVVGLNGYRPFEMYCSKCHEAPDPSIHTRANWPQVVKKMVDLMNRAAIKSPAEPEEKKLVEFLQGAAGG